MFGLLRIPPDEAQERFGHMLEAFEYGPRARRDSLGRRPGGDDPGGRTGYPRDHCFPQDQERLRPMFGLLAGAEGCSASCTSSWTWTKARGFVLNPHPSRVLWIRRKASNERMDVGATFRSPAEA